MEMRTFLFRLLVIIAAALPFAGSAIAQGEQTTITYSIEGLSTEMRDGLVQAIGSGDDLRLAFACVPAGILVFEGRARSAEQLHERIAPLMEHRIARQRIRTIDASRSNVEQQCAEARNR